MLRPRKYFLSSVSLLILFFFAGTAWSEEKAKQWDFGVGGGINLDGMHSGHLLIAPGISAGIPGQRLFRYRIEGDLELIKKDSKITYVGGIAPFIQLIQSSGKVKPFFEIGAGANLISRTRIGEKNVGGGFIFSLMGGAGIELQSQIPVSMSLRFRHLSNGSIYSSNQGINSLYLFVSARF